ncbi:MAG: substrate-binding domain-containing protein [Roseiarcus sp.]
MGGAPPRGRISKGLIIGVASVAAAMMGTGWAASADELIPQAAAAKAFLQPLMNEKAPWRGPTSAPKPVTGKRVAVIACCQAAEGSSRPANAIREAGELLGWKVDIFDGKGDPGTMDKAMNAAVDSKYDGIALDFVDTPVIADGVKRALDAGIQIVTLGDIKNTPETIPDVSHDYVGTGIAVANYMIWKSNGKMDVLMLKNTDLYEIEHGQWAGSYPVLSDKTKCPDCKILMKPWAFSEIDSEPAALALATVAADPKLDWIWCFDACMSRVSRALRSAGVGQNIRGAGFDCNGENNQLIRDGVTQVVCACDPREWEGYGVIDDLNRMFQGQPAVPQNIPIRLFDKDNIHELSPYEFEHGWQGDYDFKSAYKKLWGLKS